MPTLVRTQKTFTATAKEPLHRVSQSVQILKDRERTNMGQSHGQVLGAKPASRRSTPPNQDKDSERTNPDKTPSARAKVLPWVQGVQPDDFSLPEGMFGPYDSRVSLREGQTRKGQTEASESTRANIVHEDLPPPRQQAVHPFAYGAGGILPFAALSGEERPNSGRKQHNDESRDHPRPESEVLSRGAGMRHLNQPLNAVGTVERASPTGSKDSAGMGTFGMEAPHAKSPSDAPSPAATARVNPSSVAKGKAKSNIIRKPVPSETGQRKVDDHMHHPHHEYPFSHAEAAQKQAAAMETARAQALAQLESSPTHNAGLHPGPAGVDAQKGPRQTFETSTSGPSFGHLLHHDGHPVSRQVSVQPGAPGGIAMAREMSGVSGGSIFRIPFGVPLGAMLPRPMMAMRTSTGMSMGIGIPSHLAAVAESPESTAQRAARSAYVETVEDEQEPTVHTGGTRLAQSTGHRSSKSRDQSAAMAESGIHPLHQSAPQPTAPVRHSTPPPDFAPTQTTPSLSPDRPSPARGPNNQGSKTPTQYYHGQLTSEVPTSAKPRSHSKAHSIHSDTQTQATAMPRPARGAASITPTTISNVKRIVADSKFHDETLCQLLDAARLNLIGPEAKKALSRAARARVIELKDLRELSEVPEMPALVHSPLNKSRRGGKEQASENDHRVSRATSIPKAKSTKVPTAVEPTTPPQWAEEIITRLAAFDARFNELEKNQHREPPKEDTELLSQDIPDAETTLHDNHILLHELQGLGLGSTFPGQISYGVHPIALNLGFQPQSMLPHGDVHANHSHGSKLHSLSPTEAGRALAHGDSLTWGSEVELPAPEESVPPPRVAPTMAPTIMIQAPTESNNARTATRVASGSALSHGDPRTPRQVDVSIIEEQMFSGEPALPDPRDRSLPATPAESIQSHRPSPVPHTTKLDTTGTRTPRTTAKVLASSPAHTAVRTFATRIPPASGVSVKTAAAVTAFTHQPGQTHYDQTVPDVAHHPIVPMPWDLVTQRLYTWALVWEEDSFIRVLENISLGKQVEEMPLTIFSLMTFKRLLRRNMSSIPKKACDKLLVPPTMSDAINKAVHNKNFMNARQILEELWYPFGFTEPPRVIMALAKHRNESDHWTAHRFDLSNGHLTSYSITHEEQILADGRPLMWWHAIREAWPQYNIPHPDKLRQRVEYIRTPPEDRGDNSLKALNYARNLLLGFRPELQRDMQQLRETIWQEVKRLLQKKRAGRLVVALDSPDHVDEL